MTNEHRVLSPAEDAARVFVSESRFRVRYAETDQMGVVYYANYYVWMEIGRTDYCRQLGFAYREMEERHGAFLVVAESTCRYKAAARYDDEILVRTWIQRFQRRTAKFAYEILHAESGKLLATGETTHVVTNRHGHPTSFPEEYRRLLEKAAGFRRND